MQLLKRTTSIVLALLALFAVQLKAEEDERPGRDKDSRYRSLTILYVLAGWPLGQESDEFFEKYSSQLGGRSKEFQNYPLVGAGLKMHLYGKMRAGLSVDYLYNSLKEAMRQKIFDNPAVYRNLDEDIKIETAPVILSVEYIPYFHKQFKSYAGIGAGVGVSRIDWQEDVHSELKNDKRTGGTLYDEIDISPAIRVLGGLELGFDKEPGQYFIGSLIIELRYTHILRNIDIFKKLRAQYREAPEDLKQEAEILNGYLSLNAAVSFNLKKLLPK